MSKWPLALITERPARAAARALTLQSRKRSSACSRRREERGGQRVVANHSRHAHRAAKSITADPKSVEVATAADTLTFSNSLSIFTYRARLPSADLPISALARRPHARASHKYDQFALLITCNSAAARARPQTIEKWMCRIAASFVPKSPLRGDEKSRTVRSIVVAAQGRRHAGRKTGGRRGKKVK